MFKSQSPRPAFLCSFVFVAAVSLSLSAARVAQAGDPNPASAKADDKAPKSKSAPAGKAESGKEVTMKGEMTCAKCDLHESAKCQNVLRVKEASGKETKYYLAKNAVSDDNHKKVCKGGAPATVTGKVSEENGKKMIAASAVKYE